MNRLNVRSMETFCILLIIIGISILVLVLGILTLNIGIHPGERMGMIPVVPGYNTSYSGLGENCLAGKTSQPLNSNCISCHHVMADVERNPQAWLQEPVCGNQACHGADYSYQLEISLHDSSFITGSRQKSNQE